MAQYIIYEGKRYHPAGVVKLAMSVVIRKVAKHNWGWLSNDDERMYIQTVERDALKGRKAIHIWLEDLGTRTFDISEEDKAKLTGKELRRLKTMVEDDRENIESRWIHDIILKGWVKYRLEGTDVILTVYTDHTTFTRTIHLTDHMVPKYAKKITLHDIGLDAEQAALVIRGAREHEQRHMLVSLVGVLWIDP